MTSDISQPRKRSLGSIFWDILAHIVAFFCAVFFNFVIIFAGYWFNLVWTYLCMLLLNILRQLIPLPIIFFMALGYLGVAVILLAPIIWVLMYWGRYRPYVAYGLIIAAIWSVRPMTLLVSEMIINFRKYTP